MKSHSFLSSLFNLYSLPSHQAHTAVARQHAILAQAQSVNPAASHIALNLPPLTWADFISFYFMWLYLGFGILLWMYILYSLYKNYKKMPPSFVLAILTIGSPLAYGIPMAQSVFIWNPMVAFIILQFGLKIAHE